MKIGLLFFISPIEWSEGIRETRLQRLLLIATVPISDPLGLSKQS